MNCSKQDSSRSCGEQGRRANPIEDLLKQISKLGTDSKARRLRDELRQAFTDGYDSATAFTQYTDTMDYLKEYLAEELPGVPIACYSGAGGRRRDGSGIWMKSSKEEIKRALKEKSVRMLVCTDAAGEGLNLQFCGVVINYDLPWNPMKVASIHTATEVAALRTSSHGKAASRLKNEFCVTCFSRLPTHVD